MAKKLYVGNLSYQMTQDQLEALFAEYGTVISTTIITDKFSGRSKGFGFVEMEEAEADAAVQALNGKEVEGRALTVNEARPMKERSDRDFNRGGDRNFSHRD